MAFRVTFENVDGCLRFELSGERVARRLASSRTSPSTAGGWGVGRRLHAVP